MAERRRLLRQGLAVITRNPLGLIGAALATASTLVFFALFALGLAGFDGGPYLGLLTFVLLPTVLVAGLLLIPLGALWERRRARGGEPLLPVIDLNRPRTRGLALLFFALTAVNLLILATATYEGVEVMESNRFCGETCHVQMEPQHTAFQRSAHAAVGCVDCHVGSGAAGFVDAKLNGTAQLLHTVIGNYPRPVPPPAGAHPSAAETCGSCHRAGVWIGDRLAILRRYGDDEANTERTTVAWLHVGGSREGGSEGIHWHADPGNVVRFRAEPATGKVLEVEVVRRDGDAKRYRRPKAEDGGKEAVVETRWQVMDCTDCHNRVGHRFPSAVEAVDEALAAGRLPRELPWLKAGAVGALESDGDPAAALTGWYGREHSDLAAAHADEIARAGIELEKLRAASVFPAMRVSWGTYPDHSGHETAPGCFRCHDEELATADGETLSQDCFTCHNLVAAEEEKPEILALLEG